MSKKTYTELTNYIDTNINTNGANAITGAKHNVALNYIVKNASGHIFDSSHPYLGGTAFLYSDATFGYEWWAVTADIAAGSFPGVKTNTTRVTRRTQKLTASTTPYTGIELGTKDYEHDLGHTDFTVQAFDSSGNEIPLNLTAKTTTKITIQSAVAYANAVIYLTEIIIP